MSQFYPWILEIKMQKHRIITIFLFKYKNSLKCRSIYDCQIAVSFLWGSWNNITLQWINTSHCRVLSYKIVDTLTKAGFALSYPGPSTTK